MSNFCLFSWGQLMEWIHMYPEKCKWIEINLTKAQKIDILLERILAFCVWDPLSSSLDWGSSPDRKRSLLLLLLLQSQMHYNYKIEVQFYFFVFDLFLFVCVFIWFVNVLVDEMGLMRQLILQISLVGSTANHRTFRSFFFIIILTSVAWL